VVAIEKMSGGVQRGEDVQNPGSDGATAASAHQYGSHVQHQQH